MPLKSKLFHGDKALEACLTKDGAHLTPGTKGPHVGKVQRAVVALDGALIRNDEIEASTYGPSTAKAVLPTSANARSSTSHIRKPPTTSWAR